MKIEKVTTNKALDKLGQGAGFIGGMLASNGATEALDGYVKNKKASRGIMVAAGLATVLFIPGKTIKAIAGGVATQQGKELVKEVATPHLPDVKFIKDSFEATSLPASTDEANKALQAALAGRRRKRGMGNPTQFQLGNPAPESAFQLG